jgi:hypothetical protein
MRRLLFSAAVIVGVVAWGLVPATATPPAISGFSSQNVEATLVEESAIGVASTGAMAILCPTPTTLSRMGYYAPPPAYAFYPPAYGS